jgi:hypothetical protein
MPLEPPEEGGHPSVLQISDTLYASSDLTPRSLPVPPSLHHTDARLPQQQGATVPPSRVVSLPSPRSARSQSLAGQQVAGSSASSSANAPIRRKPLSSTASPLATRYSSKDHLMISSDLSKPESRFSRSFSVDSPTLYEFPGRFAGPSLDGVVSLKSLADEE